MSKVILVVNKNNNVDLVVSPVKTETVLTEVHIYELIENSEFNNLYIDKNNINNVISELNDALKSLEENEQGQDIKHQILERRDASISIHIEKDEMSASAEISTALGGKHISAKTMLNAAQHAGIARGFSKEQLLKLAKKAMTEPAGSIVKGEIANGKPPINGKDAQIKLLFESSHERISKPKERDDGTVDMRDFGDITCVKIGQPLAKKIPFTNGIRGYTVTGDDILPTPGADIEMHAGEGTKLSPTNDNILVSTLIGLPRMVRNSITVDNVYQIKNVDISTGHIRFEGSVIIEGDVCESMQVHATGDISVGGSVESASLEANGDITIGTGIIGKQQDINNHNISHVSLSASIKAKGKVYAKYSQYAEISCESLHIENQIMHCITNVEKTLWVGSMEKANGKLIGGYVEAGQSVSAGTIGAAAASATIISFHNKIEQYLEKISIIDKAITVEASKTSKLKAAVEKLKDLPKNNENRETLQKLITSYQQHAKDMGNYLSEKETLEQALQCYIKSIYVEATEKMYHDVQIYIGDYNDSTRREYGPSKVNCRKRKINIEAIIQI